MIDLDLLEDDVFNHIVLFPEYATTVEEITSLLNEQQDRISLRLETLVSRNILKKNNDGGYYLNKENDMVKTYCNEVDSFINNYQNGTN